uniref:MFS domain-containing protein n=1 Tax=Steinernema glaseri TaxID=37863 RepID=A0A1I7YLV5_9BILA
MKQLNDESDPFNAVDSGADLDPSVRSFFEDRKSCWKSIWICDVILALCGIQISIYFSSMWPFLSTIDREADIDFLGWVFFAFNIGQALSSPVFGFWSQKTGSTKYPVVCGLVFMAIGNLFYGLLPSIAWRSPKWVMLGARFMTGFGSGALGVLRAYVANASVLRDRSRAISLAIASYVVGLSLGPAIQAAFSFYGHGVTVGGIVLDVYTTPAFLMLLVAFAAIAVFLSLFQENLSGVLTKEERDDPNVVLPKFERVAAAICIYLWSTQCTVATNIEVLATPTTISLYNWNNEEAIFYNGIMRTISCALSFGMYLVIAFTRIGHIDRKKLVVLGLLCFISYHIVNIPWPFYEHKLDYVQLAPNSTIENTEYSGGCLSAYTWCETTARVPFPLYVFTAIVSFGFAFPFMAAPNGTLFSEILGPRRQGMMQGVFEFFGSLARCIGPLYATAMFESSGYKGPILVQLSMLTVGLLLVAIFRNRLVPMKVHRKESRPAGAEPAADK